MKVEAARPGDVVALLALRRRVLEEGRWFVTEPEEEVQDPALWRGMIPAITVAREGPMLVGMAKVQAGQLRRTRHVGHLEILVEEGWRGRGVGRALMQEVLTTAKQRGLQKVALSVYAHNERAIALYRSLGFVEEGRRRGEFRLEDGTLWDDLLMGIWL